MVNTGQGEPKESSDPDAALSSLGSLPTAAISDAMDKLGLHGTSPGLLPIVRGTRMVGRAYTVKYQPVGVGASSVGDYVDDIPPGYVAVLDNAGRTDCTVWGNLLTATATQAQIAGTVINGVCRDTAEAVDCGYPLYARGRHMRTGKDRVGLAATQVAVDLGGLLVEPDDIVVGDDDGLVVVPAAHLDEVLGYASEIEERERLIAKEVLEGKTLREARAHYGYHTLQRGGEAG